MRKIVSILAASTLLISTAVLADDAQTTSNSNDVLQGIPHDNTAAGVNIADAGDTSTAAVADATAAAPADTATAMDSSKADAGAAADQAPKAVKKHHGKKHHAKKHHGHHHHAKKVAAAPAQAAPATDANAPAAQ